MLKEIALSQPSFNGNEWTYVKECLDTGWVSTVGKYVDLFAEKICEFTKSKYATACVNGTSALHIALRIVGVNSGDEVIVPTLTFIAPVNAVRYLDANPIFMDCDEFYNIDIEKTLKFIQDETELVDGYTYNKKTKCRISAIVPVHLFGNAVDFELLIKSCKERNIKVVEDATESLGTVYTKGPYKGMHVGTIGDIGCYSFNGNKIITSGGGGMIVTHDKELADKAKYLTQQAKEDGIEYIHNEIGYNYRLTNIQAALGTAQLEQLSEYISIKKKNYHVYKNEIDLIKGLSMKKAPEYADSNYWFYNVKVEAEKYGKNAQELIQYLNDNSIQSRPVWKLNHEQKPYRGAETYFIKKAYDLQQNTIHIPCSVGLTSEEIEKVINALRS